LQQLPLRLRDLKLWPPLAEYLAGQEKQYIDMVLHQCRGDKAAAIWARIPETTDVLLTHGPPMGILDRTSRGERVGCEALREAVARVRPRLHVFGHIHEAYGTHEEAGTLFVNPSTCTLRYRPTQAPIVVELGDGKEK
jgi:Icc-related predicted phosphoesterase